MGSQCIRSDGRLRLYGHLDGRQPRPCANGDILGGHGADHPVRSEGWPCEESAAVEEVRQ